MKKHNGVFIRRHVSSSYLNEGVDHLKHKKEQIILNKKNQVEFKWFP
jgi:hypothetical protein